MPSTCPQRARLRRTVLVGTIVLALASFAWVAAQSEAADPAFLVEEGRLGDIVALGETLDAVTARHGEASRAPMSFTGFSVYGVRSTPGVLIAVCAATGLVFHAELQAFGSLDPAALAYATREGITMASSEAEVVAAYGTAGQVIDGFDDTVHVYADRGLVFAFGKERGEMRVFGIFRGAYMAC
jgi:hypothetical protein